MNIIERIVARIKEEPALFVQGVQALLSALVTFGVFVLSETQTGAILGFTTAGVALAIGLSVRPFQWPLVMGVVNTGLVLLAAFGIDLTAEQIGAVSGIVAIIGAFVVRQNVTPETKIASPVHYAHELPAPSKV